MKIFRKPYNTLIFGYPIPAYIKLSNKFNNVVPNINK